LIFIHVPKTGGTSVAAALEFPLPDPQQKIAKHYTALTIRQFLPPEIWDNAYKFAFVRNPWDRLYSHYQYRKKRNKLRKGTFQDLSFAEWVQENIPEKAPGNLQPQYQWISDENGVSIVDFIGRFDRLATDFERLCHEVDLPILPLAHLNQSADRAPYRSVYEQTTLERVSTFYAQDAVRFGFVY